MSRRNQSSSSSTATSYISTPGREPEKKIIFEYVDTSKISRLVTSARLMSLKNDESKSDYDSYVRYLDIANLYGGYVPVLYSVPPNKMGRYLSSVASSSKGVPISHHIPTFTSMKREVRALLADSNYIDLDFVNCHPTILEQVLQRNNIECPYLTEYNNKRHEYLQSVEERCNVSTDIAKDLFIRVLYLGSVDKWIRVNSVVSQPPEFVALFAEELNTSSRLLLSVDELKPYVPSSIGRRSSHEIASIIATFIQTIERSCLDALYDCIVRDGFEVGALIYDGLHIRKSHNPITETHLNNWRKYVAFSTVGRIQLEIKVKPFDIDLSWLDPFTETKIPPGSYWDDKWMDGSRLLSYSDMKAVWEIRSFKIVANGDYVRQERTSFTVHTKNKLLDAYQHLHYAKIDPDTHELTREPFIRAWMDDYDLRKYNFFNIFPPPMECPEDTYNSWTGFDVSRFVPVEEVDVNSAGVRAIIGHLAILLDNNESSVEYTLNWHAQIFQQPSKKPGIALVIKGVEGSGKTRWTDLIRLMMGFTMFLETAKPDTVLFGRFTDARRNKFLIVVNESNGKDNYAANDQLKDMITSTSFVW